MSTAIILLLVLLQVKHWFYDFMWQPQRMLVGKGIYGNPDGIMHSLWHSYGTLIALWFVVIIFKAPPWIMLLAVADGLIHYHVDYLKAHYGIKDSSRPLFWKQLGSDQLAHQLTYVAIVITVGAAL